MINSQIIIQQLIKQFGEDVPIKEIASYAEREYMIPYYKAVELIRESVRAEL